MAYKLIHLKENAKLKTKRRSNVMNPIVHKKRGLELQMILKDTGDIVYSRSLEMDLGWYIDVLRLSVERGSDGGNIWTILVTILPKCILMKTLLNC